MATQLSPCLQCHRHIRATETRCPFCEARVLSLKIQATAIVTGFALLAGCNKAPDEKPTPVPVEQPTSKPQAAVPNPTTAPNSTAVANPTTISTPTTAPATAPTSVQVKVPEAPKPKPVPERESKDIYGGPPPPVKSPAKIYGGPPPAGSPRIPLSPKK